MRLPSLLLPAGNGSVDGKLVVRQPLIHLAHVLLAHIEPLGKQPRRGLEPLREKLLLLLAQVEEELALRLRRPELHHAPVVHQVPQDVRANPPRRVGGEFHAAKRVVFLHRVHQAHVPFLDQIEQAEGGAPVFVGDLDHQPQIRGHQPVGDLGVVRLLELHRQPVLLFAREQRVPRHLCHVALQRIGARQIALDRDRKLRVRGRFQVVGRERLRLQDLRLERLLLLPLVPRLPWRADLRRLLRVVRFGSGTHLYSGKVRCYTGQLFRVQAEMSDYVATTSFADLPLSEEVRKGIAERGYTTPTPVQAAVFEPIFAGRDLICRSKTGTGKTAAFGIPLLERIPAGTRRASALVLCNTRELALQYLRNPETILLSGDVFTVEHIHNVFYHLVDQYPKPRNLLYLIECEDPESAIIFCNLRTDTELVANVLNRNGLDAEMLNGDLPQKERERVMAKVKRGEVRFMVATDIAARGIDISDLSHVLNYSLPEDPAVYLHRVGRTGRIGKKGTAISLVSGAELNTLSVLEKKYGIRFEVRSLPTPEEARRLWTEKHMRELREAMQSGVAFEAFIPLAQDLMAREDGRVLTAYALRYFFVHHRMEKAQIRAAGEKLLESHQVEKVHKEQKEARRKRDRDHRRPRLEAAPPPVREAEPPADRVKLYVEQGSEHGWTAETLMSALSQLAGRPRETALAADVKPRYAYVLVRPDAREAYVAASGKELKEKPVRIEVARPRRR